MAGVCDFVSVLCSANVQVKQTYQRVRALAEHVCVNQLRLFREHSAPVVCVRCVGVRLRTLAPGATAYDMCGY